MFTLAQTGVELKGAFGRGSFRAELSSAQRVRELKRNKLRAQVWLRLAARQEIFGLDQPPAFSRGAEMVVTAKGFFADSPVRPLSQPTEMQVLFWQRRAAD